MNAQPEAKSELPMHAALPGTSDVVAGAGIKILQCNNEYCQYERRNNGNIEWASQSNRLV